ncbi:MAG: ATP-dependent DNA helicase RecG [Clostridia bacterium]
MIDLNKDVKYIKGVGPARVELLNKLGIFTLKDLITYYPRTYEDRNKPKYICECEEGEEVLIEAIVCSGMTNVRLKGKTMQRLIVRDETGSATITWFNQTYLKSKFKVGDKYKFFGKVSKKAGKVMFNSPVFDVEEKSQNTGRIIPIYPLTYNLSQNNLRKIIEAAMEEVYGKLQETLPQYLLKEYNLENINDATKHIHFPDEFKDFNIARNRLVFEELLSVQLALLELKNSYMNEEQGIKFSKEVKMSEVIHTLPFKLTKAQLRVLEEIDNNMESEKSMNRLLQGDVGSGKTVVAMCAAYKAVKSGYQAAIMAPTAILATQHLENFKGILEKLDIKCELLISGITKKRKEDILERLRNGDIDILIGTHAIIEENVVFKNLGLVVTDEQHRFGVKQRTKIAEKGNNPDVLVMTATPIPRTLALILYGDLDISIIDELPPNRKKVETFAVGKNMTERVNHFIKKQIQDGRQAYVVCPLVEENEEMDLKSVEKLFETYRKEIFPEYRVEYIHGKMRPKDKDSIMERFKNKEIDILISTTVIEVGVDVPNSNIMVIENAERFGLAQLHQLRGRVGRGEYQSYCILKFEGKSENVRKRMKVMCETNDGFIISEKDLELRGAGDFFGTMQHGLPEFKIANLFEDIETLKMVQSVAMKILSEDPKLEKDENKLLKELIKEKFIKRIEI